MRSEVGRTRSSTGLILYDHHICLAPPANKLHVIFLRFYETNLLFFLMPCIYYRSNVELLWISFDRVIISSPYWVVETRSVFIYITCVLNSERFVSNVGFLFFQVYSFEGKAVQVHGMRKRLLPVSDFGGSQNPAHGRISPQMPGLQQEFQPKIESEDSSADA